uniref:Uncharacterized protein n=1 Tax=Rhodosorus marinus TaxID=101924 RepID=A0A7S3A515_9RHOD|mmetsp:Transcript_43639/g.170752  ORF Transcript_43639/g.170752 Transcript_43639/m.170752 type:complete len:178 (+) Transcript_43639:680-1213(+)
MHAKRSPFSRLKLLAMEAVISTSDVHTMESVEELYVQYCSDRAHARKESTVAGKTEKGIRAKETVERSNTDPVVEETGESSMAEENIDYEVQETPPVEQQQTPGPTMFEKDVSEETADVPSETGLSRGEAMNTKGKDSSGRMEALQKNPTGPGERFLEDELNAGELEPQNPKSNPEG